ncbi:HET-domain-containing protein [Xylariaceae sp. AK1471]|nr:HET-domain-containing protein [Xylariaceae sp. AK1471]
MLCIDGIPGAFPTIQTGHLLSNSTSSEETLVKIKGWIDDCQATHGLCRTGDFSQDYIPKRILRLSDGKIVLREGIGSHTYACLSHCWGPSQSPIKTLSTTLESFKQEIPWRSLSKTLQDAVDICRRLGVQYLWIDSLCIIQDSDEDWAEESIKMAKIYENAFLTIAATKSKDGTGGCYSDREDCYVNCGTVIEESVFIRRQMPRFGGPAGSKTAEGWPLLQRGWVYQEMSLSTRVLHFGSQEVVWQCRTHRRSESGSNDSDHANITFSDGHAPPEKKHNDAWDDGSPNDHPWYDIVNDYSGLALSFEKDKLPALAANSQASAKKRAVDDRFLAGLWKDTLLHDMLWETYPQSSANGPTQKPAGSNSPSWSWASPIGSPYLGRYSRCELVFRGPLIATTSQALEVSIFMKHTEKEQNRLRTDEVMAVHQFTPDYVFDLDGPVYGPATSLNFILPLMIQHGGHHLVVGIVLRPTDNGTGAYERVGLVILVYVKRGPPIDVRPENCQEWDYHPWRPITRQWINTYLSSLSTKEIIIH